MTSPEVGKLYRSTRQYWLRRDQDLNFSNDSSCKLIDAGEMFFLARVIERRSPRASHRILWLYQIIYGEQIGYIFSFDTNWSNEMTLFIDV